MACQHDNMTRREPGASAGVTGMAYLKDPLFNLKLACEEMTLLEQHYADPEMRCDECIRKHLLYIQGVLREAMKLDTTGELSYWLSPMVRDVQLCAAQWQAGQKEPVECGQIIRTIRANTTNQFKIV